MNQTCEGSNQPAGYDYGTEAWFCQECLAEFHRRDIQPGATVPVHSTPLDAWDAIFYGRRSA